MWLGEADLFMREVEGWWCRGLEGRCQACEGRGAGQFQGVAASRQAEAGAALHGWESQLCVANTAALDTASTVAPPLLHRCPHTRALRAPGRAAAPQLVRTGQGSALTLTGWSRGV